MASITTTYYYYYYYYYDDDEDEDYLPEGQGYHYSCTVTNPCKGIHWHGGNPSGHSPHSRSKGAPQGPVVVVVVVVVVVAMTRIDDERDNAWLPW